MRKYRLGVSLPVEGPLGPLPDEEGYREEVEDDPNDPDHQGHHPFHQVHQDLQYFYINLFFKYLQYSLSIFRFKLFSEIKFRFTTRNFLSSQGTN